MGKKWKVELNKENINAQLLNSSEIASICEGHARDIQSRCGSGYTVKTNKVGDRVSSLVFAETQEARLDNLKHNTILKAVGR